MKHFINPENLELYAYEADGSQDDLIPESYIPTTSDRPSHLHRPVITSGKHTGWFEAQPELPDVQTVTKLALKRELEKRGIWQDFRTLISSDTGLWDEWLIANDLRIDDPITVTAATSMGWPPDQVQQLFNDTAYGAGDA